MELNCFPFLKTGVTKADFHSNGILPMLTEIWKRLARTGADSSAILFDFSLSSLPDMLSGPVALWGLVSLSSLRIL